MNKDSFGATLRTLREREKLSVKEVIAELQKYGQNITDKTLYSYENDKRAASADMLLALCQIYNCSNILETFAGIEPDYSIPDDSEWKIIETYRSLDSYGQESVEMVLNRESKRVKELERLLSEKESRIAELETTVHPMYYMAYYHNLASAGTGEYIFEDLPTDTIEVPANSISKIADFVIGVNGDSMEPTYHHGEKVYVEKMQVVEVGDIGIFMVNGECFIKEAGKDGLISHNPLYDMIPGTENIQCIGKVLGKVEEENIDNSFEIHSVNKSYHKALKADLDSKISDRIG